MLETTKSRAKERAQVEAERGSEAVKDELGRLVFEAVEEYFPEQARARRRRSLMKAFVAGVVVGALLAFRMTRPGQSKQSMW